MVEYHPISAKDQCGRESGKGDNVVADLEDLDNLGAPEIHARRLNAKEVITPKNGEHVMIPVADGKEKINFSRIRC